MLLCASAVLASVLALTPAAPASATSNAVTVTASSATVAPGSTVDLTAAVPVSDAGTLAQEIVQVIDPAKVRLTSASDITYPAGWTLSYCSGAATDCTNAVNFSATTPASAAAWAAVKAVKATGTLVSSGSDSGRQVARSTASGTGASTAPATLFVLAGVDGFQVFFDANRTRAFNIYHHESGSLDCWVVRTGARCPGFPYAYGGYAAEQSIGRVVGSRIWIPGSNGLYCGRRQCELTASSLQAWMNTTA